VRIASGIHLFSDGAGGHLDLAAIFCEHPPILRVKKARAIEDGHGPVIFKNNLTMGRKLFGQPYFIQVKGRVAVADFRVIFDSFIERSDLLRVIEINHW
jgi:hypothetical protein